FQVLELLSGGHRVSALDQRVFVGQVERHHDAEGADVPADAAEGDRNERFVFVVVFIFGAGTFAARVHAEIAGFGFGRRGRTWAQRFDIRRGGQGQGRSFGRFAGNAMDRSPGERFNRHIDEGRGR